MSRKQLLQVIYLKILIILFLVFIVRKSFHAAADHIINGIKIPTTDEEMEKPVFSTDQTLETKFQRPDDKWTLAALQEISYYLRSYKFNEWDRRIYMKKPEKNAIGYYNLFPVPMLNSLHWEVKENCLSDFYKCIIYLHKVIDNSPDSKNNDPLGALNENKISALNESYIKKLDLECNKVRANSERLGSPFDGPNEKFEWRTTAAYFMCWYTMLETSELLVLNEFCDNFANCIDPEFGFHNKDPRANDQLSFACAKYSFCPDPCCPRKHIKDTSECLDDTNNPCHSESYKGKKSRENYCNLDSKNNQNFNEIMKNKWNVTCVCRNKGFKWDSQFGLCVDVNECKTKSHNCEIQSEDCLNLPGSYKCICKWGYQYDKKIKKCVHLNIFTNPQKVNSNMLTRYFKNILE